VKWLYSEFDNIDESGKHYTMPKASW